MESLPLLDVQRRPSRPRSIVTIEPALFLYCLYTAGTIPIYSQFVRSQLERRYNSPSSSIACSVTHNDSDADHIDAEASIWLICVNVAGMIPSFFVIVLLGGYSNAAGCKNALVPPLIGAAARLLLSIIVVSCDLHFGLLILASACEGFTGGICAMLMASFSYIASITDTQTRSQRVVVVEVAAALAVFGSSLSTGYAIHLLGFAWTFVILLSIIFTSLSYVVFILPEVYPMSATAADTVEFFTLEHFRRLLALYVKDDANASGRQWKLRLTLLVVILTSAVQLGGYDVQTLFMLSEPFCFTPVLIGYFYATSELVPPIMSLIVTHIFVRHVGDLILIVVGLLSCTGYELMFGFSHNRIMLFMAIIVGCASRLPIALVRAYNSKIVEPHETGLMFASVAWMELAGSLVGEVMQNGVLAATVGWMNNFVFILGAGIYFLTAVIFTCFIGWLRYKNLDTIALQVHNVDTQSVVVNSDTS